MQIELEGVFAPVTTTFDAVTGEVDVVAFRRNVRSWMEAPLAGLLLFGSTGEGVLLDEDERIRLLEASRELVGERVLLAGTGAESTRAVLRGTHAAAGAGADAVLVHPPAFYRPDMTADALRDHYLAVADGSPIPVLLYQIPSKYSGVELNAGLVGELSRHPNIVGIKDSSGDLKTVAGYVEACDPGCAVLVGSGAALYAGLEVGARGGIIAVALLAAHAAARLYERWRAGDVASAGRLQERIAPVHRKIIGALGVAGVKAALDLQGLVGGPPRSPLKSLRPADVELVRAALAEAGLLEPANSAAPR